MVEADERFFCAMSGRLMTEPVRHSSGVVCDRVSLNDWFISGVPLARLTQWGEVLCVLQPLTKFLLAISLRQSSQCNKHNVVVKVTWDRSRCSRQAA